MKRQLFFLVLFGFICILSFSAEQIIRFQVKGNEKTRDFVVAQLVGYKPGMALDIEHLYLGKRNLENSGYFEDVYISVVPEGDDYGLVVTVKETSTFYPYFGPMMAIGVGDRNLLGLGIDTYAGIRFLRFDGDIWGFLPRPQLFWGGPVGGMTIPRVLGSPIDLGIRGFLFREVPWYQESFFKTLNRLTLSFAYHLEPSALILQFLYESATLRTDDGESVLIHSEELSDGFFIGPDRFSSIMVGIGYRFGDSSNYERLRRNLFGDVFLDLGYTWNPYDEYSSFFSRFSTQINYYYRIIAQLFVLSETNIAVTPFGAPPVTQQYFPGQVIWQDLEFNPRHYVEQTFRIGIPLTGTFGLAPTLDMAVFTPKLYLKGILGDSEVLGAAVGIGFHWKTPIGISLEPQVFLRERAPLIQFSLEF